MTIKHRDLANVDLHLLVALDALLTERSVTRAASQVGTGQSAMSSSLARLRKLLGDELLTRGPEGMQLTPRAMALIEPVRAALRQFQGVVMHKDAAMSSWYPAIDCCTCCSFAPMLPISSFCVYSLIT